jgi:serine/threonine protein kinase
MGRDVECDCRCSRWERNSRSNRCVASVVFLFNPLKAIILELGCCIEEVASRYHGFGTPEWIAPEVVALKRLHTANNHADLSILPAFTANADVWAANISWMELFRYERPTMRSEFREEEGVWGPSPSSLDRVRKGLGIEETLVAEHIRPVYPLLIAALVAEPSKRPSAKSIAKELKDIKDNIKGDAKIISFTEPSMRKPEGNSLTSIIVYP